ncbi:hypothetical protein ABW19_dt0209954 [Dactylella cylindrospora]|nr:hypothetical protein ABW19_dt0209954 [Dactylella cylindrospora]
MTSPQYATIPASPNKIPSAQATPTFVQIPEIPNKNIMNWSTEDVVTFMNELGLPQYPDAWIDNEVTGEALIHLNHEELLEMGIESIGHRLQILKAVYKVKISHEVPIEPDHYVPITANPADANPDTTYVTVSEFQQLISAVKIRDDKVYQLELELRRVNEAFHKLREEMLPIVKTIKNETKPLPKPSSNSAQATSTTPTYNSFDNNYDRERERDRDRDTLRSRPADYNSESVLINREPTPQPLLSQPPASNLSRKYSTKKIDINPSKSYFSKPTTSPTSSTGNQNTIREQFAVVKETGSIDSIASTLVATPGTAIQSPPTGIGLRERGDVISSLPTPASPHNLGRSYSTTTRPRGYGRSREDSESHRDRSQDRSRSDRDRSRKAAAAAAAASEPTSAIASPPAEDEGSNPPTVEIFKSFRVSMDDPCYKVLPAALKRYNIQADWQHYALYIVYGDQERCLGYDEKPLILFKQLDKEGKKPMFMLRRHINPETGQPGGVVNANPPGGVL